MNGRERLYWQQNAQGHVFLSDPASPVKRGFQLFSTVTPSEMDRIFAKIDRQEQKRYSEMTEAVWGRQRAWLGEQQANVRHKIANSHSEQEKDFLHAWLKAFDNKMDKLMKNTVYGVSAMQEAAAPIPAQGKTFTVDDIRLGRLELTRPTLELVKPATEVVE
jgi:hypothetical protein